MIFYNIKVYRICYLAFVFFINLSIVNIVFAEMPEPPNYEELCEGADIILSAKFKRFTGEYKGYNKLNYSVNEFEVVNIYKGVNESKKIHVLIPGLDFDNNGMDDIVVPNYMSERKYFLFLKQIPKKNFIRIELDNIWPDRPYSSYTESLIKKEIAFLANPERWKKASDNLSYSISEKAEPRPLTGRYSKNERYSKRLEYWLDEKLVGKRGWYKNGQIAYETSVKDGHRHGISKSWYPNGSSFDIRPYRKGRLHGILMYWNKKQNLQMSFWIRGEAVSMADYIEQSQDNLTLQKITIK